MPSAVRIITYFSRLLDVDFVNLQDQQGIVYDSASGKWINADISSIVLPSQSGNAGKFLYTDGSNLSWSSAGFGVSGFSGYSSTSGFSGYSGMSGFSGYGQSGFSGYGQSGFSGYGNQVFPVMDRVVSQVILAMELLALAAIQAIKVLLVFLVILLLLDFLDILLIQVSLVILAFQALAAMDRVVFLAMGNQAFPVMGKVVFLDILVMELLALAAIQVLVAILDVLALVVIQDYSVEIANYSILMILLLALPI